MKQLGLSIPLFIKRPKVTRRQKFLEEMEKVIPWAEWTNRIAPHYPAAGLGRKPFELEAMLRIHLMQQWFGYSDPGMEEALHDVPLLRGFAGLDAREDVMPDETTILKFRHLLEMMWRHDSGILLRYSEKWLYTPLKEALNKLTMPMTRQAHHKYNQSLTKSVNGLIISNSRCLISLCVIKSSL